MRVYGMSAPQRGDVWRKGTIERWVLDVGPSGVLCRETYKPKTWGKLGSKRDVRCTGRQFAAWSRSAFLESRG